MISRSLLPWAMRRLVEALVGPWWTWRSITRLGQQRRRQPP